MSFSVNTTVSDGVSKVHPISFTNGIYDRDNIHVTVEDDLDGGGEQLDRSFSFINDGVIELDVVAPAGKTVTIRRIMNKQSADVDYVDGAVLDEVNLDQSNAQLLNIMHEVLDGVGIDQYNQDIDMNGHRIKNMLAGTDPTDAATIEQVTTIVSGAATGAVTRLVDNQLGSDAIVKVFTLNIPYVLGTNSIEVRRNGLPQNITSYTETSSTEITMIDDFNDTDTFTFIVFAVL